MEPRKNLKLEELDGAPDASKGASDYFESALTFARRHYSAEMDHIASTKFSELTPEKFFLEYIWVVHATGFNAAVVGKMLPKLVKAYGTWDVLGAEESETAVERVRKVCNNPQKIGSVHATAYLMKSHILGTEPGDPFRVSWEEYRDNKLSSPEKLRNFPYIGKITCFHLARNIGLLESIKPDLHLIRMAKFWGFEDCVKMCEHVREEHVKKNNERLPLGIIDLVLWYAASTFGTLDLRKEGDR